MYIQPCYTIRLAIFHLNSNLYSHSNSIGIYTPKKIVGRSSFKTNHV
jgi:hypothetical protein